MRKFSVIYSVVLTALLAFVVLAGKPFRKEQPPRVEYMKTIDTLWKRDTIFRDSPRVVEKVVRDSILIRVTDTLKADTVFVQLPRESKLYREAEYSAQVSGYEATLDWVEIYRKTPTIYVESEKKPPRVRIGAALGPTIVLNTNGEIDTGLGATFGLTVNF